MWADTLQTLERDHLLRLIAWGGLSVLSGTALLLLLVPRQIKAPLAVHFAVQCALWGAIELIWGLIAYRHVPLRDYGSAYALWRSLLFAVGAEIGGLVIGATLAVGGWAFGKRLSTTGAGFGIVVQSAVLLILDLIFLHGINL